MSDDATVAANTIAFEDGDGAPQALPAELTLEPKTAAAPDAPVPVTPPVTPPEMPPPVVPPADQSPPDPEKAGILAELGRTRSEAKTLKQFRDQAAPILQALQKHQDLLETLQQRELGIPAPSRQAQAPTLTPVADDGPSVAELTEIAKDLVLYKADGSGQPDVDAARRVWERNERQVASAVAKVIERDVAPLRQTVQGSEAQAHKAQILLAAKQAGVEGSEIEQILDGFIATDPKQLADPRIGVAAILMARGMKGFGAAPPAPTIEPPAVTPPVAPIVPPTPVFTERPGARPVQPATLTRLEQRTAKARGMNEQAWTNATAALVNAPPEMRHIVLDRED